MNIKREIGKDIYFGIWNDLSVYRKNIIVPYKVGKIWDDISNTVWGVGGVGRSFLNIKKNNLIYFH